MAERWVKRFVQCIGNWPVRNMRVKAHGLKGNVKAPGLKGSLCVLHSQNTVLRGTKPCVVTLKAGFRTSPSRLESALELETLDSA